MGSVNEIHRLIRELDSLNTGRQASERLAEFGPLAVEPLRRFLLEGVPRKIFHPRFWAVEALARLGAREVLLQYLFQKREIPDCEDRFGEEAVESAAARFISGCADENVYGSLLELSERRVLVGLIDALAEFRRPETMPYFERALEDDFYRSAAEEAFLKMGASACGVLAKSAVTPRPNFVMETRSSLQRRRSALRLLNRIGMPPEHWRVLRDLIHDPDEEVTVSTSVLGIGIASKKDRIIIAHRLLELVSFGPWYLQGDVEDSLIELRAEIARAVEEEILRRMETPEAIRAADKRLQALLRIRGLFPQDPPS